MGSTSDPRDPKPEVVTGYPAGASAASAIPYPAPPPHGVPYFANPNPNGFYQNPYPNPNGNGYYPNPDPNSYNRAVFLRRLLAAAIAVFLIIGAITFMVWLILRPKLPDFSVSSLDLSSFNLSSPNSLSSEFNINLTVRNPNSKMSIAYDDVTAAVLYGDYTIAQTSLFPFYQKTGNVTAIRVTLVAAGGYVDDRVANGIRSDLGSGGRVVRFSVRVLSIVKFKAGAWRTRRHVLRVLCDGIGVGFKNLTAGVGSMVGPAQRCLVGL